MAFGLALGSADLSAAPKKPAKKPAKKAAKKPVSKTQSGKKRTYVPMLHRLRFGLGLGRGDTSPAIINEAGPSWMINSAFAAAADPENVQGAVNIAEPEAVPYISWFFLVDYAYRDRWFLSLSFYNVSQKYSRAQKTSADFFAPASTNRFPAVYEGVRLLRYQERLRTLELTYLHPLFMLPPVQRRGRQRSVDPPAGLRVRRPGAG